MSVTYGALIRQATQEVALGSVALLSDPPSTPDAGRDLLCGYQDLLRALARHTHQLLEPHLQPGARLPPSPDRAERTALALADELTHLAGRRSLATQRGPYVNHWYKAALAVGAAGDLLATHADRSGLPRSPDLLGELASRVVRRDSLAHLSGLTVTVLGSADDLTSQVIEAGLFRSKVRRQLPDSITAQVLARESAQHGGPSIEAGLDELRTARPAIDRTNPLAELGDRMAHLRRYAWAGTQAALPSVDDLKVFAVLGVAVHTHAEAVARRTSSPVGDEPLLGDVDGTLMPRSRQWRAVAAALQPWQTAERAHPAVIGHARRVRALLVDVAPLADQQAVASVAPTRDVAQALRAAVQVTDAISVWNAATVDGLPRSHVTMPARLLTGDQVTDDPTLAAAKLADWRIDVPTSGYRGLRDAYAAVAGRPNSREGILEPVLTAQLERTSGGIGLVIERA